MSFMVMLTFGFVSASEDIVLKYFIFKEECYADMVQKGNFSDVECMKFTVSKLIGLLIVGFSSMLKVP